MLGSRPFLYFEDPPKSAPKIHTISRLPHISALCLAPTAVVEGHEAEEVQRVPRRCTSRLVARSAAPPLIFFW